MVMYANEVETRKRKITWDKNLTTTYPFIFLYALFFIKHLNTVNTHYSGPGISEKPKKLRLFRHKA